MQIREAYPISTTAVLLTVILLTFTATSPVISASKCSISKSKKTPSPVVPDVPTLPIRVDTFKPESATKAPGTQSGSSQIVYTTEDNPSAAEGPTKGLPSKASQESPTTTQDEPDQPSPFALLEGNAPLGDVTSAEGECVISDPNTYVTREDVDWVWENTMKEYVLPFENLIFDQLVTSNGSLSYCVRWDNDEKLTKAVASKFQDMVERQMNLWHDWLVGYNCWPFEKVDITVVSFAVRDKSIMDWSDDSLGTIYEGILDGAGSPMCPDECYKHRNFAKSADTSACEGEPFDMSLWPSTSPGVNAIGAGGDWGQRVEISDMLQNMDNDHMMVLLHEIGHGFGLPDLYLDENKPSGYPACVMDQSLTLTDGDGWILRSVLDNIKSRYDF